MPNKVKAPFKDLTDDKKLYKKGDSYSHNDGERVAFLVEKGFLGENKPAKKGTKSKKAEK